MASHITRCRVARRVAKIMSFPKGSPPHVPFIAPEKKGIALPDRHRLAPRPWQVGCSTSVVSCHIFRDSCTESIYPLVICYIAIENGHRNSGLPMNSMVIFHSYVKLPEGI